MVYFLNNNRVIFISQVRDHSERAAWMGTPVPLDLSKLSVELDELPRQYPDLGLGYSAK